MLGACAVTSPESADVRPSTRGRLQQRRRTPLGQTLQRSTYSAVARVRCSRAARGSLAGTAAANSTRAMLRSWRGPQALTASVSPPTPDPRRRESRVRAGGSARVRESTQGPAPPQTPPPPAYVNAAVPGRRGRGRTARAARGCRSARAPRTSGTAPASATSRSPRAGCRARSPAARPRARGCRRPRRAAPPAAARPAAARPPRLRRHEPG